MKKLLIAILLLSACYKPEQEIARSKKPSVDEFFEIVTRRIYRVTFDGNCYRHYPIKNSNDWIEICTPENKDFDTAKQVIEYIKNLDPNKVDLDPLWMSVERVEIQKAVPQEKEIIKEDQ